MLFKSLLRRIMRNSCKKMLNSSKKQDIRDIVLFNLYKNKGEVKASRYDYFSIKQELEEHGSELRF